MWVKTRCVAAVDELGVADLFSLDRDGVAIRSGGDGGGCAGLVVSHVIGFPSGSGRGRSVAFGSGRSRQPCDAAAVSLDGAEAGVVVLPHPAVGGDVVVAASDEVPPHDQLLGERWTAEQQRAGRAVAQVVQRQDVAAGALKRQVRDIERGARHLEAALVQQHAVLEGRLDVERNARAGVEIDLSAEQRCEGVHG